jgi:hypothetical protein
MTDDIDTGERVDPNAPGLLSRHAAARYLGCSVRQLHYYRQRGALPAGAVVLFKRRSGGHPLVRYRLTKLEEFERTDWVIVSDGEQTDGQARPTETGEGAGPSDRPVASEEAHQVG